MKTIDLILSIPLLWGLIIGFKKGLVLELASLFALILGIWGSIHFSSFVSTKLTSFFEIQEEWLGVISFLVTFSLIVISVFLLARLLNKTLKLMALGFINRLSGAIFGLLKYSLLVSFLLYFFDKINDRVEFVKDDYHEDSYLYQPMIMIREPFSILLNQFEVDSLNIEENIKDLQKELSSEQL